MTLCAVNLSDVSKRYGRRTALDSLDLAVPVGSIFGMVGSNGAGKTTSIGIMSGLVRPDDGTVDVLGAGPFSPARHAGRVALMPQDSQFPPHARLRDFLLYCALLQGVPAKESPAEVVRVLEEVHLTDRADSTVRTLSHGMRRRAAIAQSFLGHPELILMDEPMSGLDPREAANVREILRSRRAAPTILISSHDLHDLERMCDHVAFIENGKRVRQDSMDSVTGRDQMITYAIRPGHVPTDDLRSVLPGAAIELSADESLLTCRYPADRYRAERVNRLVLHALLEADVDVLEIHRGGGLEKAYLEERRP